MFRASRALQAIEQTKEEQVSPVSHFLFKGALFVGATTILLSYFVQHRFNKTVQMETLDCDDEDYDDEWMDEEENPAEK